ncbi:hypothetical protein DFP75_102587 [Marinomonas alcarazii]|uniref:Lipoprotein n=1 Tax=Marinomonas alcarazii TaxID=491949 RepID=A0A318V6R1_9GAMM|nr:DUF6279 family lipoprotein [Marinomonas alcarazii]PYF83491.1 hypothetical protein DFP75_102587 [Marinomonas alcarazii]
MKKAKLSIVLLFSFILSACSSSFAYNNLDWLLYWYVDDYIDLSSDQEAALDERIASWHSWHRSTELEKYQTQLNNLRAKLESGALTEEQWLREFAEAQQHLNRFRTKIAPELAGIAQTLSTEQVEDFLSAWHKKRQERQSESDKRTESERLMRREERLVEFMEDNVGKLSEQQTNIIKQYVPTFISISTEQTAYHSRLQNALRDIFSNRDSVEFKQRLTDLIRNPDQYKTVSYQASLDHNAGLYARMLAELNLTFTEKQKLKLDDALEDWINLIEDLISD